MKIDSLRDMRGIMIGFLCLVRGIPAIKEEGETGSSCRGLVGGDIKLSEDIAFISSIDVQCFIKVFWCGVG